jgi:ElaB/YqjD/DUF883 family membrane-anchored ribosome-binding protein
MAGKTNGAAKAQADTEEVVSEVSKQVNELGRQARKTADDAKGEAVKGLNSVAETIRREVRESDADESAIKNADKLAANLEKAANYLNTNTIDDIKDDAEKIVEENTLKIIIVALIVGILIGLILRGGRR